jgi:hypothetical protein
MKLASDRASAPARVFASDLYKPSITYQGSVQDGSEPPTLTSGADLTLAPIGPKVMQIDDGLAIGPDPLPD